MIISRSSGRVFKSDPAQRLTAVCGDAAVSRTPRANPSVVWCAVIN